MKIQKSFRIEGTFSFRSESPLWELLKWKQFALKFRKIFGNHAECRRQRAPGSEFSPPFSDASIITDAPNNNEV
jgi:hypothetical protein